MIWFARTIQLSSVWTLTSRVSGKLILRPRRTWGHAESCKAGKPKSWKAVGRMVALALFQLAVVMSQMDWRHRGLWRGKLHVPSLVLRQGWVMYRMQTRAKSHACWTCALSEAAEQRRFPKQCTHYCCWPVQSKMKKTPWFKKRHGSPLPRKGEQRDWHSRALEHSKWACNDYPRKLWPTFSPTLVVVGHSK